MDHGSRVFLQLTLGYLIGRIVVSFAFLSAYHLLLRTNCIARGWPCNPTPRRVALP